MNTDLGQARHLMAIYLGWGMLLTFQPTFAQNLQDLELDAEAANGQSEAAHLEAQEAEKRVQAERAETELAQRKAEVAEREALHEERLAKKKINAFEKEITRLRREREVHEQRARAADERTQQARGAVEKAQDRLHQAEGDFWQKTRGLAANPAPRPARIGPVVRKPSQAETRRVTVTTKHDCRIRAQPDKKAQILGFVYRGNKFAVMEHNRQWKMVNYQGRVGYLAGACLR